MKKWIILLLCAILLIAVVVASIAVVSAQSDAEAESSAEESENMQSENTQLESQSEDSESADESDSAPSEDESVAEPIGVPEVVTFSHMAELTGAERTSMEVLEAALKLYAGQNVKYRVQFYMDFWEEDAIQDAFYRDLADGSFGTVYAWNGVTLDVLGYPEHLYADLTEADLRTVLAYGKTRAWLIDEFPKAELIHPATEVFSHFKSAT